MRLISDNPLGILLHVVRQYLPMVWVPGDDLPWLKDPTAAVQAVRCFADKEMTVPLDFKQPTARLLFTRPTAPVTVVAGFAMEMPVGGALLLRHDLVPLYAHQTEVSEKDGVLRLFGAEKSIMVLTPQEVAQASLDGKKLIRGGIQGSAFRVELRDETGDWNHVNVSLPADLVTEVKA